MSFFLVRSLKPIVSNPAIQSISNTRVFSKERAEDEAGPGHFLTRVSPETALFDWN
jgi:hypothetical protein